MTNTIIPAGYRLTVTSWENDGDNYNTKIKEGLTLEQCRYYVDLCKLLKSQSRGGCGNMFEPSEGERKKLAVALQKLAKKHGKEATELDNLDDRDLVCDQMLDVLYDLGLSCGEFYTRVCDTYKVEHIAQPIELEDVTAQFK